MHFIFLVLLQFYLADTLDTQDWHGQAGEVENKCPRHQHLAGQGGWYLMGCNWCVGKRICLLLKVLGPRQVACVLQAGSQTFGPLADCSPDPWTLTQGKIKQKSILIKVSAQGTVYCYKNINFDSND